MSVFRSSVLRRGHSRVSGAKCWKTRNGRFFACHESQWRIFAIPPKTQRLWAVVSTERVPDAPSGVFNDKSKLCVGNRNPLGLHRNYTRWLQDNGIGKGQRFWFWMEYE